MLIFGKDLFDLFGLFNLMLPLPGYLSNGLDKNNNNNKDL